MGEAMNSLIPVERIEQMIFNIRGQRVMLDADLAALYGVPTKRLNEQVRRNKNRFPSEFMFVLTRQEHINLRSQIATSRSSWGGPRYAPMAFTEHGAIMLASVLNSKRANEAIIYVVRAFVRMREFLATHKEISQKLAELERKVSHHDQEIRGLFDAIRQLMSPRPDSTRKIGFIKG